MRSDACAQPSTLLLVDRGRILHRNLRQELMSADDLMAKLREKGVERPEQVKRACMESDGTITVIKRGGSSYDASSRPPAAVRSATLRGSRTGSKSVQPWSHSPSVISMSRAPERAERAQRLACLVGSSASRRCTARTMPALRGA